ncbi:MAG: PEP-CTERM sorting domain-containing protein [Candidatus Acidiferrales bacterium]
MNVKKTILRSSGLFAVALLIVGAARGNSIPNPNFTVVGPSGSPFSTSVSTGTSAAADWGTFVPDPSSVATTELLPSTDTLSGDAGNMLSFATNAGFDGSAGNGVFTTGFFTLPAGTTGFMDINVPTGTSGEIGFVVGSAFSAGSYSFSGTSGWQRITFSSNSGATDEFGFEIFSAGGGSMLVADPTAPTPEPGTLLLLASGLPALGFLRRRFIRA